jgi:transposase InsO family protein
MTTYAKTYVTGCDTCQRMKNRPQQPYGPLMPNPIPHRPWDIISVDLITQLPESDGYDAICVVVDRLTKRAHFFAITNEFSAKDLANLLYERVWTQHGLPLQIISDRGVQFAAKLFQEWCQLLGIQSSISTTYHPQTDSQTERVNQSLEQYLHCYVDYQQDNWSRLLFSTEFAYNNASHESTKTSPFFLEYG